MTDTNPTPEIKPDLGIGRIMGGTLDLYFKNFPLFFGIVFVPYIIYTLLVTDPLNTSVMESAATNDIGAMAGPFFMLMLASIILFVILQAVITRVAISIHVGQGPQIGAAVRGAVVGVLPILLLGIVASIATGIAFLLLIIPGLYVLALLYVYVPAIVFEGAGFSALGRSEALTKGYRWAIVGLILLLAVLNWVVSIVAGIIIAALAMATGGGFLEATSAAQTPLWLNILTAALQAIVLPIGLIASGLVYARLREIKEGGSTSDLLRVFE